MCSVSIWLLTHCSILDTRKFYNSSALGVLLRKLESGVSGLSHIVIDEIHERDINVCPVLIDF